MTFAKRVFTWATAFGLLMILPLFLAPGLFVRLTGQPIHDAAWFYGFAEVALGFQAIYLLIGRDPVRYRPLMPVCALAKFGFGVTVWSLVALGRTSATLGLAATPDMIWAGLFLAAYRLTPDAASAAA